MSGASLRARRLWVRARSAARAQARPTFAPSSRRDNRKLAGCQVAGTMPHKIIRPGRADGKPATDFSVLALKNPHGQSPLTLARANIQKITMKLILLTLLFAMTAIAASKFFSPRMADAIVLTSA
jgi:hypothetical protein